MNVTEAMHARKSIRNFLDTPVPNEDIKSLLESAARAPSGGNVQPWRIYVLNGESMSRFKEYVQSRTEPESPAYAVYPPSLKEPYRSSRFKVGEDMYALLGIPREDKPARLRHLARNYDFFGASSAIFVSWIALWVHLNGRTWECFYKASCSLRKKPDTTHAPKKRGHHELTRCRLFLKCLTN